jgi:hypothetical protein
MGRKIAFCILVVILTPYAFGAAEGATFALSVKLKDRYNADFRVCTLVRIHAPLQIEWTHGAIKSRMSALLGEPEGDVYPLSFAIEETAESQYSESTVLKLKLGKTDKSESVVSSAFNDIHEESVLLTQKGCE